MEPGRKKFLHSTEAESRRQSRTARVVNLEPIALGYEDFRQDSTLVY